MTRVLKKAFKFNDHFGDHVTILVHILPFTILSSPALFLSFSHLLTLSFPYYFISFLSPLLFHSLSLSLTISFFSLLLTSHRNLLLSFFFSRTEFWHPFTVLSQTSDVHGSIISSSLYFYDHKKHFFLFKKFNLIFYPFFFSLFLRSILQRGMFLNTIILTCVNSFLLLVKKVVSDTFIVVREWTAFFQLKRIKFHSLFRNHMNSFRQVLFFSPSFPYNFLQIFFFFLSSIFKVCIIGSDLKRRHNHTFQSSCELLSLLSLSLFCLFLSLSWREYLLPFIFYKRNDCIFCLILGVLIMNLDL